MASAPADTGYVQTVSGRRTTAGAAMNGAGQAALYGLAWGVLFSRDSGSILGLIGYSVLLRLLFGAAIGA
jgi:hypothetical protein